MTESKAKSWVSQKHLRSVLLLNGIRAGRIEARYSRDYPGDQIMTIEIQSMSEMPAPQGISPQDLTNNLKSRLPSFVVIQSVSYQTLRWTFKILFEPWQFMEYYPSPKADDSPKA